MKAMTGASAHGLQRLLHMAEECWHRKDYDGCVALLERANREAPAHTGVLLQLGRVCGLHYDYAAAERWFERALKLAPRKAEMLGEIARRCADFRDPRLANDFFTRATQAADASATVLAEAAEHQERQRNLDAAAGLLERALSREPLNGRANLLQARLDERRKDIATGEQRLRNLRHQTRDEELFLRASYELGAQLDRQARYDEAMAVWLEAKARQRAAALRLAPQQQQTHERLKSLRTALTPALWQTWMTARTALQPERPLALLCGHPRSGTTLLEQVLDAHPDIISAEETEIFNDYAFVPLRAGLPEDALMVPVLTAATEERLRHARAHYFQGIERALGQAVGSRTLIDKNPSLTFFIPAFARIFPEAKFLLALRDPRDVVLSCFMQAFVPLNPVTACYNTLTGAAEEYAALLSHWLHLAPNLPCPHLQVRYEDMVEDLESVARRVLGFLGAPWNDRVLGFDRHAREKIVRSPTYADVTQPVFQRARGRWLHYQKHLEPALPILEPVLKSLGYE